MNVLAFGPFQLNPETVQLFKNGEEIVLEPQVFDALLLLLKNRDRVISKTEMFEELWQGRTLTDHVITRIIYELRKVLDDPDNEQSYIRTVRGKGYQFNQPVQPTTTLPSASQEFKHKSSTLRKSGLIGGLVLLGLLSVLTIQWWSFSKPVEQGSNTSERTIVAVLPIDVSDQSDEIAVLSYAIIDQMTAQLNSHLNMLVIHPDSLNSLTDQLHDLWAIQQSTHADYIIQGHLEKFSESDVKIRFELHKASDQGQLIPFSLGNFMFPYPTTSGDLKALYKQQRDTVRELIQLIKPGVTVRYAGHNETDDPEAYRMVLQAHHLKRQGVCQQIYQSEQLLRKATERDPEFAYAWYQLYAHYFKLVYVCGQSTENYHTALAMAEKVEQLAPGKYPALIVGRNIMLTETNQVETAFALLQNLNTDNPSSMNVKVYTLRYAGFLNLAVQHINQIRQLDPYFYSKKPIYQAPNSLLYLNQFDEHLSLLAEPGHAYHDYYRSLNLVLSNRPEQAKPILSGLLDRGPDDLFGQFSQALSFILNQDPTAAKAVIDQIAEERLQHQHFDGEMAYKLAQLYAMAGYSEAAIKQFQLAVDHGFFSYAYFIRDPALDAIRLHPQFDSILLKAKQRHLAFAERFGLTPELD